LPKSTLDGRCRYSQPTPVQTRPPRLATEPDQFCTIGSITRPARSRTPLRTSSLLLSSLEFKSMRLKYEPSSEPLHIQNTRERSARSQASWDSRGCLVFLTPSSVRTRGTSLIRKPNETRTRVLLERPCSAPHAGKSHERRISSREIVIIGPLLAYVCLRSTSALWNGPDTSPLLFFFVTLKPRVE